MKKIILRLGASSIILSIIILIITVGLIASTLAGSNQTERATCLAVPDAYSFMVTRFHNGDCQFRENDGWQTFTPAE